MHHCLQGPYQHPSSRNVLSTLPIYLARHSNLTDLKPNQGKDHGSRQSHMLRILFIFSGNKGRKESIKNRSNRYLWDIYRYGQCRVQVMVNGAILSAKHLANTSQWATIHSSWSLEEDRWSRLHTTQKNSAGWLSEDTEPSLLPSFPKSRLWVLTHVWLNYCEFPSTVSPRVCQVISAPEALQVSP